MIYPSIKNDGPLLGDGVWYHANICMYVCVCYPAKIFRVR
jgi:hypothetical protein